MESLQLLQNNLPGPVIDDMMGDSSGSQIYKEGKTIIYQAPQRGGKTLSMAIVTKDEAIKVKNNIDVLTNVAFQRPETQAITIPFRPLNFFELTMEKIKYFNNRVIDIDELNFYISSRACMTKVNRRFCEYLLQSKKMGIINQGTSHNLYYLDIIYRENFDYLVLPEMRYEQIRVGSQMIKKPRAVIMRWMNGPNQKPMRSTVPVDFHKFPNLLGLYDTRFTFNPFQEIEEHAAQEKVNQKVKLKQMSRSALSRMIPEPKLDTSISNGGM